MTKAYSPEWRYSRRWVGALAAAFTAVLLPVTAVAADVTIPITFDGSGCPQSGVPDIDTTRGKKIAWQAFDTAGNESRQEFRLYFDPLKGYTLKAPNGRVEKPIDGSAPIALYKYTVVGKGCEDKPLDPNIRVNN